MYLAVLLLYTWLIYKRTLVQFNEFPEKKMINNFHTSKSVFEAHFWVLRH